MNITGCIKKSSSTHQGFVKRREIEEYKIPGKLFIDEKQNSHNRPLKNKTIPGNVRRGTNNFRNCLSLLQ